MVMHLQPTAVPGTGRQSRVGSHMPAGLLSLLSVINRLQQQEACGYCSVSDIRLHFLHPLVLVVGLYLESS